MFKKTLLSVALLAASGSVALASGFGFGGQVESWSGSTGGYASSATTGGSMAQGNVNNTGLSAQFTANEGGGYANASAHHGGNEVVTYSGGGSHAANVSAGFTAGQAGGATAGAVGTDFSSEAWGSFETGFAGAHLEVWSGFGNFGGNIPQ